MTRTPEPGPPRKCVECGQAIPYPPAGLTPANLRQREYARRAAGLPAEYCIATLDANGQPASQCVKCGQENYYQRNPQMRPPADPNKDRCQVDNVGTGNRWEDPRDTMGGQTDA